MGASFDSNLSLPKSKLASIYFGFHSNQILVQAKRVQQRWSKLSIIIPFFGEYKHTEPEYILAEMEYNHTNLNITTQNLNITTRNQNITTWKRNITKRNWNITTLLLKS